MFRTLFNFFRVWVLVLEVLWKIKKQKQFVDKILRPAVRENQKNGDASVSDYEYYKVLYYYGVGIPVVVGEGLALLRNEKLKEKERKALTYMASITGLYDDFFDITGHSKEELLQMTHEPEKFEAKNQREKLFKEFTLKALEYIEQKTSLERTKQAVFDAQWASKAQEAKTTTWQEQKDLVLFKGGTSLDFYKDALNHKGSPVETTAIYKMGGMFQYGNDIFDVYQDIQEKSYFTCVTMVSDINVIVEDYLKDVKAVFAAFRALPYPEKSKEKFIRHLKVVVSQCLFCLSRYQKLQVQSGGVFKPKEYTRKELVCDMEKPLNLIKTAWLYAKLRL